MMIFPLWVSWNLAKISILSETSVENVNPYKSNQKTLLETRVHRYSNITQEEVEAVKIKKKKKTRIQCSYRECNFFELRAHFLQTKGILAL